MVRFAIHPVAGRLPGHMNVLLAEANVPYDIVIEMDEINADFPTTDVAMVIGANDIVNPAAEDDPSSADRGHARAAGVEGQARDRQQAQPRAGYAGIDNPLFYKPVTRCCSATPRMRSRRSSPPSRREHGQRTPARTRCSGESSS